MSDQAGDQVSDQVREQIGDQVNGTDIQRNDRTIKAMEQVSEQASEQVNQTDSQENSEVRGADRGIAGEQVQMLVNAIREDTVTMFMIQKRLNNASRSFSQMKMLKQAIAQGYVLRAFPDKRSHSKQRYYLSEKGAKLVKIIISTDKLLGCPKCKFCPWLPTKSKNCNTEMEKKKEESNEKEELTLQNVPKAVNYLINEIAEMRAVLEHIESQLGLGVDKHRPIDEERAAEILGQTKNVIKKMVRAREIPHYDKGRKIYFFEDELIKWVEQSRVKTFEEEYKRHKRLY